MLVFFFVLVTGALSGYHYIEDERKKVFEAMYKWLQSPNAELQETAHACMEKFISGFQVDTEHVHGEMRPLLLTLGDYRDLTLNIIKVLSSLTQLFPNMFNEKLCEQLLVKARILKRIYTDLTRF